MAASAVRSFLRSSSIRSTTRVARYVPSEARASISPPCIHKVRSDSPRIIRSLAMLGCCDSLLPMHNATAAALMTSMLSVSMKGYGWLSEGRFSLQVAAPNFCIKALENLSIGDLQPWNWSFVDFDKFEYQKDFIAWQGICK